jgi:hypothetical protein
MMSLSTGWPVVLNDADEGRAGGRYQETEGVKAGATASALRDAWKRRELDDILERLHHYSAFVQSFAAYLKGRRDR